MSPRDASHANSHTGPSAVRLCLRCQAHLRSENRKNVCTCHTRSYDPRTDSTWPAKLESYARENIGSTVHPTARFGIVREARYVPCRRITAMRKDGWTITSTPGKDIYHVIAAPPDGKCDNVAGDSGESPHANGEIP